MKAKEKSKIAAIEIKEKKNCFNNNPEIAEYNGKNEKEVKNFNKKENKI
jgi:hypothetical protein